MRPAWLAVAASFAEFVGSVVMMLALGVAGVLALGIVAAAAQAVFGG